MRVSTNGRSAAGGTAGRSALIAFSDSANFTLTGAIGGFRTNSNTDYSGGLKFFYNGASTSSGVSTLTEGMRLDSSGNVGIGTSAPNNRLVVSNNGAVGLEISTPGFYSALSGVDLLSYNRGTSAYAPLAFITNSSSNSMVILTSGNVGIGTTSPNVALTVSGSVSATGTIYQGSTPITTLGKSVAMSFVFGR